MVARLHRETRVWQSFLATHRNIVDKLADQMLADHDLPLEWFDVLIHLASAPEERLRQRGLRDSLLLSESGVSRLCARMARAGLIARLAADEDRRGVTIALTEEGRRRLALATESHLDHVAALFTDRLEPSERAALETIMTKLKQDT
jgi:DNA-binding MarR family transcriptional regulator